MEKGSEIEVSYACAWLFFCFKDMFIMEIKLLTQKNV